MKKFLLNCMILSSCVSLAQNYSPIAVSGFNMDGIAETSPANGSTSGPIDNNDYVLYTAAYGVAFFSTGGLPDNGTIANGNYNYQFNSFSANNTLHLTFGQKDSLILTTPAPYDGLSLLGFSTEGSATIKITVRFTDGTNETFTSNSLPDWFYNPNPVINGFDRTGRTSNYPDYQFFEPRMYSVEVALACTNRNKNVSKLVIENMTSGVHACLFALSGISNPTYSVSSADACYGMSNGSASVVVTGGLPAFTYSWTTNPVQNTSAATSLSGGTYTVTVADATGCIKTLTTSVSQPTAALTTTIATTASTLCAYSNATLTTSGATTYTWSNGTNTSSTVITPTTSATYSVTGTTAGGCPITGTVAITANPRPVITFSPTQTVFCSNSPSLTLSASPSGGTFSGSGITGSGNFSPSTAGIGTQTISYSYTNSYGCSATSIVSTTINAAPVVSFSMPQNQFCVNSLAVALTGTPAGGVFSGTGMTGTAFIPAQAGVGTYTITYTYTNTANCQSYATSTATVNACTGIEELSASMLMIYPNPGKGIFNVQLKADLQATVSDQTGRIIDTFFFKAGDNSIDLSGLAAGIYIIHGQNGQQSVTQKLVILD